MNLDLDLAVSEGPRLGHHINVVSLGLKCVFSLTEASSKRLQVTIHDRPVQHPGEYTCRLLASRSFCHWATCATVICERIIYLLWLCEIFKVYA